MPSRVLVAGAPQVLEAVRRALPELEVAPAPLDPEVLFASDCVLVGMESERFAEAWGPGAADVPVVRLLLGKSPAPPSLTAGDIPCAHVDSPGELRLAIRTAILEHRAQRMIAELTGAWAHDARGALGVARLALELFKGANVSASPIQKMENGLTRLGFLLERLPSQLALALDLPLPERGSPTLFPNLESYVRHLRLVHSQRQIELLGGDFAASEASRVLVPFAAGFADLALSLCAAKAGLRFSADRERGLEVECECADRPPPWHGQTSLGARELTRLGDTLLPYRLLEAARLAVRLELPLTVQLSQHALRATLTLDENAPTP